MLYLVTHPHSTDREVSLQVGKGLEVMQLGSPIHRRKNVLPPTLSWSL